MSIELVSPFANLRVSLEPPEEVVDARFGKRKTGPGKQLRFTRHKATCPDEWWPLLETHSAWTGQNGQKMVYRADDDAALPASASGPAIAVGMATHRTGGQIAPPLEDWDQLSAAKIKAAVDSGRIKNLESALNYELGHLRRKMVVRHVTDAMLGDSGEKETKAPEPEAVAESYSAPAPDDLEAK
jgi:hypothetical protein